MVEKYALTCRVWAYAAWTVVAALLVTAWLFMLLADDGQLAVLIGITALATSAVAAVAHMRVFAVEHMALTRAVLHGRVEQAPPELHRVR